MSLDHGKIMKELRAASVQHMKTLTAITLNRPLYDKMAEAIKPESGDWSLHVSRVGLYLSIWLTVDTFKDERLTSLMERIEGASGAQWKDRG